MSNGEKDIELKTGLSLEYAQKILTRDINCRDSILDLIDNSIDSARCAILNIGGEVDARGMPVDYDGYEINIGIDKRKKSIYIEDTCSGIEPGAMQERLLVIGEESNEHLAIGHFGVGLKRALLKLGNTYRIETSYEGSGYMIACTAADLTKSSKTVVARHIDNKKPPSYTQIHILDVSDEAKREVFRSNTWEQDISKEISIRYSIFINKGLVIKYQNIPMKAYCPGLRNFKSIKIQQDDIGDIPHGIDVRIKAGMHEHYRFTAEEDYDSATNSKLTEEYGWYYVCNDRVIKIACTEYEFGWAKKWHPEYYGFVGWVYFTGNVKYLPWNTKKTDIDPSSEVFSAIKRHLKKYADTYRRKNRGLKKGKEETPLNESANAGQISLFGSKGDEEGLNVMLVDNSLGSSLSGQGNVDETPLLDQTETISTTYSGTSDKPKTRIEYSSEIADKLRKIDSQKLGQLYKSLCGVSLVEHSVLMSVGAWAFFETLAKLSGANADVSFNAYFNGKINAWFKNKQKKKMFKKILTDISDEGNLDKHESHYHTIDARPLAIKFSAITPVILKILDEISEKASTKSV